MRRFWNSVRGKFAWLGTERTHTAVGLFSFDHTACKVASVRRRRLDESARWVSIVPVMTFPLPPHSLRSGRAGSEAASGFSGVGGRSNEVRGERDKEELNTGEASNAALPLTSHSHLKLRSSLTTTFPKRQLASNVPHFRRRTDRLRWYGYKKTATVSGPLPPPVNCLLSP